MVPPAPSAPHPAAAPPITPALALALAYDRYVAALWRGESEEVRRFGVWLKGCWGLGPPEPAGAPAAVSALVGAGTSIRWHQVDGVLFGYIPGVPHRCYQVPADAEPPAIVPYGRPRRTAASGR